MYCLAEHKYGLPACQMVGPQCAACKTDYRFGFDMDMDPIKPNHPVPAIPLHVEYSPWTCVHGHEHTMISITEKRYYENDGVSSSLWNTVELW